MDTTGESPTAPSGVLARPTIWDALGLVGLIVLTIGFFPFLQFPGYTPQVAVLMMLGLPGLAWITIASIGRDRVAHVALAVVGWVVVAGLASGAPTQALIGSVGRDLSALTVIGAIGAWGFGRWTKSPNRHLAPAVAASGLALNALVGVLQVVGNVDRGSLALQFGRATGFTPNPVYFGGLMAAAASLLAVSDLARPIRLVGVTLFACAANLSGSRVAIAALLTISVALIVVRRSRQVVEHAAAVAGGLVVSVAISAAGSSNAASSRFDAGGDGRLSAWRYGLQAVGDRPIFGWGFGRFRAATQGRFSADFVRTAAANDLRQSWFDAHNVVIAVLVAVGLVGFGLVTALVVTSTGGVASPVRWFAATLALTWMAQPAGLATLPLVALLWGYGSENPPIDPAVDTERPPRRWSRVGAAAAALGVFAAAGLVIADARMSAAIDSGDPARMERAARWFPLDPVIADAVAQGWLLVEPSTELSRSNVIKWSLLSVEREPDRPYFWARLAARQFVVGKRADAFESLDRALALQPWHRQSWLLMAEIASIEADTVRLERATRALCALGEPAPTCPV